MCDGKAFRLHSYGFMKSSNRYGRRRVRDQVSHGARSIVRRGRVFSRRSTLLRRLRRLCCQRKCHQLGGRGKRGSVQLGVIRGDERVGKMYLLCKDCIDLPMCYPNASCPPQCSMDSILYHLFKRPVLFYVHDVGNRTNCGRTYHLKLSVVHLWRRGRSSVLQEIAGPHTGKVCGSGKTASRKTAAE